MYYSTIEEIKERLANLQSAINPTDSNLRRREELAKLINTYTDENKEI